jgi:hypothetical protein
MRSLLGRFHRPFARGVDEQLLLLNNLGDGSTLSLDFTTGVLDPRLTFTRTTNATFINSQGLVQYAGQNLYFNTAFGGLSGTNPTLTSSGWTYAFSTGSANFHGDGSVTMTASSQRIGIARSSGFTGAGRRIIASVDILTVGDTGLTPSNLLTTGTFTNSAYYVNSGLYTAGNVTGPCTLSFVFDSPTSGTTGAYFGVGMTGNSTATVKFANPRLNLWNGVVPAPYLENTSTTAERHDPRFDYDPTTPQPRGLLIEGSASNLCPNSQALTTGWGNANMITPTNPAIADPFGGTAATWKLVAASGSALHSWRHPVITLTAAAHTFSFWAKADVYDRVIFSDPGSGIGACTFVLTGNGTATVVGGATNPLITPYPNGWYRCSVTITTLATTYALGIAGYPSSGATLSNFGATYTGNGTDGAYATGLQIELGSGASSYIPTGASTGSRAADSCVMTGSNFSSWFNATEGTLLAHAIRSRTSDIGRIASVNDNTANESIELGADTTGEFIVVDGGSTLATISPGTVTANTAFKIAGAYKLNDVQAALGGTLGTADTSVTMPTVDRLMIGQQAGASPVYLNGTIALLKYWPTRLPNAQLQALTT